MIRLVALLSLCAGCGRFGFGGDGGMPDEATPDVVIGHDEDGDGIPDAIDTCPATAGSTPDSDGDGVGDACDPDATAANTITVFSPLTSLSETPFDDTSMFTQDGDGIRVTMDSAPTITRPLGTARMELGFTINAMLNGAQAQHQIACGAEGSNPYYFVELNDNGGVADAAIYSFDAVNQYVPLDYQMYPGMHTGRGIMRIDLDATNHAVRSQVGWVGEMYSLMSATPGYLGGHSLRFALNGLDVTLDYIMIVEAN